MNTFVNTVLTGLAVPLTGMLCAACYMAISWLKARTRAEDIANLDSEVHAAIGVGVDAAVQVIPGTTIAGDSPEVIRRRMLEGAATYFRQRFPDRTEQIIKAAGVDADLDYAVHDAVKQTIVSRLTQIPPVEMLVARLGAAVNGAQPPPATTLPDPSPVAV